MLPIKINDCDITTDDLYLYSQCPRKYSYSIENRLSESLPLDIVLTNKCIQTLYTSENLYAGELTLKSLQEFVDTIVFRSVPSLETEKEFEEAYSLSSRVLALVSSWYTKIYVIDNYVTALPNIILKTEIAGHMLKTSIPMILVKPNNKISLVYFSNIDMSGAEIYNDIRYQAIIYLTYKELGIVPKIEYLVYSERAVYLRTCTVHDSVKFIKKIEKILGQLCNGIHHKIFYLSKTNHCDDCIFLKNCSL